MTAYKPEARSYTSYSCTETTVTACDKGQLNTKSQSSHKLANLKANKVCFQHFSSRDAAEEGCDMILVTSLPLVR